MAVELRCIGVVAVVVAFAIVGFFGQYAFDDSYIGYRIANTLLAGHGLNFNSTGRLLSTSAPLAIPIYAGLSSAFGWSVVFSAQVVSAVALVTLVATAYSIARKCCSPVGAAAAAIVLGSSPFTILLWSHETLLYLATATIALACYLGKARRAAAIIVGCAVLFRGEALLLVPFFAIAELRRSGLKAGVSFFVLGIIPYAAWMIAATAYFGTFLSESIASKQAQALYPGIIAYLPGIQLYFWTMYEVTPSPLYGTIVEEALVLCLFVAATRRFMTPLFRWTILWTVLVTLLYVVLRLPFYFWFASQFGVLMAACAAMAWHDTLALDRRFTTKLFRAGSLALVTLNLAFLVNIVVHREQRVAHGPLAGVMSSLQGNAYQSLGTWFSRHARPRDTISFAEFGQIAYYSNLDIVDYLGLVTPGAAKHLRAHDAVWTIEQYRPTWFVDSAPWHVFVDPTRYRWFASAYHREAELRYPGDPVRSDFVIYRLRDAGAIPTAHEQVRALRAHRRDDLAKAGKPAVHQ